MSGAKIAIITCFILLLAWLILVTLGNLGFMDGSTQKYVKQRKWDKMREYLKKLYAAKTTDDTTICKKIRDWWADNQESYDEFIAAQLEGDPETLNDWTWGFPVEIKYTDFIKEYFEDVGKENAEDTFLDIAKGTKKCEDDVDMTTLKDNVVRIITPVADQVDGYDPLAGDCSNVTTEQSVLPNYVWSYDDDTFIDISNLEDDAINSVDWRKKHKMVCTPLAMDEEYIPASSIVGDGTIVDTLAKIKFTNVTNPISGTKIEVFEEGQGGLTTGLTHTFSSSTTTDFEIPLTAMTTFNKPLYVIKLDGKETDHVFAGNVGTIAFKETKAAKPATPGKSTTAPDYVAEADATPAEYDYTKLEFKSNIEIPVGYDIIVEATAVPSACATTTTDREIVAKYSTTTNTGAITKGVPATLTASGCYTGTTDYIPATYTAYIRKTKADSSTENPKHKFSTLTLGVFCDASTAPTNGLVGTCTNKLASGSWCQPKCTSGYTVSGTSSCTEGVLTAATCSASST